MPRVLNPPGYFPVALSMNMHRRWSPGFSRASFDVTLIETRISEKGLTSLEPGHTCPGSCSGGRDRRITWAQSYLFIYFSVVPGDWSESLMHTKQALYPVFGVFELVINSRVSYSSASQMLESQVWATTARLAVLSKVGNWWVIQEISAFFSFYF